MSENYRIFRTDFNAMNMDKSIASIVKERISQKGDGELFAVSDFEITAGNCTFAIIKIEKI